MFGPLRLFSLSASGRSLDGVLQLVNEIGTHVGGDDVLRAAHESLELGQLVIGQDCDGQTVVLQSGDVVFLLGGGS